MERKNTLNIPFDKFACEKLWALSSFKRFLFEEYPRSQNYSELKPNVASLILQFDRHIDAAIASGEITGPSKLTNSAFAGIEEPVYYSQKLLKEIKFRGYPVPEGLIEAREKGDWVTAVRLLQELHENMKGFIKSGGKIGTPDQHKSVSPTIKQKSKRRGGNSHGRPAPEKAAFIKEIQKRSKQKKFASDFKRPYKYSELVYCKAVVTALNPDGEFRDLSTKSDEEYEKHCNGIPPRRVQEKWLPEALPKEEV